MATQVRVHRDPFNACREGSPVLIRDTQQRGCGMQSDKPSVKLGQPFVDNIADGFWLERRWSRSILQVGLRDDYDRFDNENARVELSE